MDISIKTDPLFYSLKVDSRTSESTYNNGISVRNHIIADILGMKGRNLSWKVCNRLLGHAALFASCFVSYGCCSPDFGSELWQSSKKGRILFSPFKHEFNQLARITITTFPSHDKGNLRTSLIRRMWLWLDKKKWKLNGLLERNSHYFCVLKKTVIRMVIQHLVFWLQRLDKGVLIAKDVYCECNTL